jgi:ABC-type phosphate transport system permease subunit
MTLVDFAAATVVFPLSVISGIWLARWLKGQIKEGTS